MGYMTAIELARMAKNGEITLEKALSLHLEKNHFPPFPAILFPACVEAIENVKNGRMKAKVKLPRKVTWRGKRFVHTKTIVEDLHLEPFIHDMESLVHKCLDHLPSDNVLFLLGDALVISAQRAKVQSSQTGD